MTSEELFTLLRSHPRTCRRLFIRVYNEEPFGLQFAGGGNVMAWVLRSNTNDKVADQIATYLLGKAIRWLSRTKPGFGLWCLHGDCLDSKTAVVPLQRTPTFLHMLFHQIESTERRTHSPGRRLIVSMEKLRDMLSGVELQVDAMKDGVA
jgi:hypothetical protein